MALFAIAGLMSDWFKGSVGEGQASAMFGSFSLGAEGYGAILGLVVLIAAVTAGTARLTVHHTLKAME
jgi:cell division transport system permease protein